MKKTDIIIAKVSGIGNCKYVATAEEVPSFLLEDHSVRIVDSGLEMYCVDGTEPAVRPFPVFLKWETASEEKKDTLVHIVDGVEVHPSYGPGPKTTVLTLLTMMMRENAFRRESSICVPHS